MIDDICRSIAEAIDKGHYHTGEHGYFSVAGKVKIAGQLRELAIAIKAEIVEELRRGGE